MNSLYAFLTPSFAGYVKEASFARTHTKLHSNFHVSKTTANRIRNPPCNKISSSKIQRFLNMNSTQHQQQNQVIIETDNNRYALYLDGVNQPSVLEYEIQENVYDLIHTFVPDQARGKGVAGRLVKRAVEHARENGHKIIPSCSYIHTYMKRHPDDQDVLLSKL